MFNRGRFLTREPHMLRTPFFFKIWFAFCASVAVVMLGLMIWAGFKIVPALVDLINRLGR